MKPEPSGPVHLSVVIPLKDEAESVPVLAREIETALAGLPAPWECVWVDDGSTDGSLEVLRGLARTDPRHRYLSLKGNHGQSAALLAGFRAARGEVLATMDADLQNDPADLPRLLEEMEARGVGLVNGVRVRRADSWVRKVSSRIANGFRNLLTGESVTDVGCSLRVFRREYAEALPPFRGMHRFLPTFLRLNGCTVAEVPVRHRSRTHGVTKYGISNRLWVGIADTFGVCWLKRRWARAPVRERSEQPGQDRGVQVPPGEDHRHP